MHIHAHFQGLQPLDWALLTCKKAQNKNDPTYSPTYAKVLILALPIFEAYEALYCLIATSVCALKEGVNFFNKIIQYAAIVYVNQCKDLLQGVMKLERAALLCTSFLTTVVVSQYILFPQLVSVSLIPFIILNCLCLSVHSIYRDNNQLFRTIDKQIIQTIETKRYQLEDFFEGLAKTVLYSFNIFVSPLFLLMSHSIVESYHKKMGLAASKPKNFRELHWIANRVNNFNGFERLVSKKRCKRLVLEEISVSNPLIGFINIIENPNLAAYIHRMLPDTFKALSQFKVTNSSHLFTNLQNLTISPLSHLCDRYSRNISEMQHLLINKRLKRYVYLFPSETGIVKKIVLDFLSTSPESLIYEAFGNYICTLPTTNGQVLVQTESGLDAKRWTFLKYGLKNNYFHRHLSAYPYTQSKLKEMHQIHTINRQLSTENFTIFKDMLVQDLTQFIASRESVEISILLSDKDLLNQIFKIDRMSFKTDMRNLIEKYPVAQRELMQIRDEVQNTLTLFSEHSIPFTGIDLEIFTD